MLANTPRKFVIDTCLRPEMIEMFRVDLFPVVVVAVPIKLMLLSWSLLVWSYNTTLCSSWLGEFACSLLLEVLLCVDQTPVCVGQSK